MRLFIVDLITIYLANIAIRGSYAWAVEIATAFDTNIILPLMFVVFLAVIPGISILFTSNCVLKDILCKAANKRKLSAYPDVTVVIPAYNEEEAIRDTIYSVASSYYTGKINIIVTDDASTDNTVEIARKCGCKVLTISKEDKGNGRKAENLNRAMKEVKTDLVITIDADTIVDKFAIRKLVAKILQYDNIMAVAGNIQLKDGGSSMIQKMQQWDYAIGIYSIKIAQSQLGALSVAHGACSIYRYDAIKRFGFFKEGIIGEDIKITYDLAKETTAEILYEPSAMFYTDSPEKLKDLFIQRRRWGQGAYEMLRAEPGVLFRLRLSSLFTLIIPTFPMIDSVFLFIFIPAVLHSIITLSSTVLVGPKTLLVFPFALLCSFIFYTSSKKYNPNLKMNFWIIPYIIAYPFVNIVANIVGFFYEVLGIKKW